ncbi:DUF1269 domain-containing protein [Bdellovibrio sp. HCB337]|uniref:DUF1269 domain-containing protein n=1 Tax=Bdellovibrio sp. HCB337 TaxID=3394358 RepID=UPI0039A4D40C
MNDLFAILYPDPTVADSAMKALVELSRSGRIELTDACAVVKDENGHVQLHQETNLPLIGSVVGLAIGTVLGWFVLLPYLGIPAALIGALVGKFTDHGIEDSKMKDLTKEIEANTSVLFFQMRGPEINIVLEELAPLGGRIFHSSLSKYQEEELEEMLSQLKEHPKVTRIEEPEVAIETEELIIAREEDTKERAPGPRYRVVWYYTQWPQGSEYAILASGLTREEAEKLREKKDPHLKGDSVLIEEENPGPEANP